MNKNILAVLILVSMIPGILSVSYGLDFFSGNSITGNIILDDNTKPLCTIDSECDSLEKCCMLNNQNSGVCTTDSKCSQINSVKEIPSRPSVIESPMKISDSIPVALFFGFAIAVLVLAIGYAIFSLTKSKDDGSKKPIKSSVNKISLSNLSSKLSKNNKALHKTIKTLTKNTSTSNVGTDRVERYIVAIVGIVGLVAIIILLL